MQALHFTRPNLLAKAYRFISGAGDFDFNHLVLDHFERV